MKHVIAFATIGTCLLVLSGGAALATSPPTGPGQPGHNPTTNTGLNCGTVNTGFTLGPSANAITAPGSPFNSTSGTAGMNYAGTGTNTTSANPAHAFSNYDVACFQVH